MLRGDRLGKLDVTLTGTRLRNLAVPPTSRASLVPAVPAGTARTPGRPGRSGPGPVRRLAQSDPRGLRPDQHFAKIAAQLSKQNLSDTGEPPTTTWPSRSASALPPEAPARLLHRGAASSRAPALRSPRPAPAARLRPLPRRVRHQNPGDRVRVYGESDGQEHVLMELVLERKRVAGHPVLYVHWLSLRHPRGASSRPARPAAGPGGPGLGLARETGEMLALMALRLGLTGVVYRPAHFHTAFAGRHHLPSSTQRATAVRGARPGLATCRSSRRPAPSTRAGSASTGSPTPGRPTRWCSGSASHPEERGEVALERERAHFSVRCKRRLSPVPTTTICQNPPRCGMQSGSAPRPGADALFRSRPEPGWNVHETQARHRSSRRGGAPRAQPATGASWRSTPTRS